MYVHGGFRALWPVIFFLPWVFLGVAYLLEWMLQRHSRPAPIADRARARDATSGTRLVLGAAAQQRASRDTRDASSSADAGIHQSAPRAVETYSGQR